MRTLRRTSLFDRNLLYLFSYDVNLEMRREEIGFVPGGVRINILAKPGLTRLYHVARELTAAGQPAVAGTIAYGADWALVRTDDMGELDVRLTITTDDNKTIYSRYNGVYPAGDRGFRRLISEDPPLGSERRPFEANVYITPRYECADPKYRWLNELQCVGFGRVSIIKSTVRSGSFDIYAMDG